jgi:hypothetical protein
LGIKRGRSTQFRRLDPPTWMSTGLSIILNGLKKSSSRGVFPMNQRFSSRQIRETLWARALSPLVAMEPSRAPFHVKSCVTLSHGRGNS